MMKKISFLILITMVLLTASPVSLPYAAEDGSGASQEVPEPDSVVPDELDEGSAPDAGSSKVQVDVTVEPVMTEEEAAYYETLATNSAYTVALLLVLVGFEILRIVKGWTLIARGGKE